MKPSILKPPNRVPTWLGRLEEVIATLESWADPWIDRSQLEVLLQVKKRRAQQLMQPLTTRQVGCSLVVHREALIAHLRQLGKDDRVSYERQRQAKLGQVLDALRQDRLNHPQLLVQVEDKQRIWATSFSALPPGVSVNPGEIRVQATNYEEAAQKLLALAMAMANVDPLEMDRILAPDPSNFAQEK